MKKDILTLLDLEKQDVERLCRRALELKQRRRLGIVENVLAGKTVGLLFDKASTRTRLAFEAAVSQLGGASLFISIADTQLAREEPVEDTARVMSRYLDGLAIRTYAQQWIETFARHAAIPVVNALTDSFHPTQVLSDLMTVLEVRGGWEDLTFAWVGDGNNMANSWIHAAALLGFELVLACPEGYDPDPEVMRQAAGYTRNAGRIRVVRDPVEAVRGAHVVNTDVWASMGQEAEQARRVRAFAGFQVNEELLSHADADAVVMHCLPAHRGEEISAAVLEGRASVVWDQAENKMHMAKAIWAALIAGEAGNP